MLKIGTKEIKLNVDDFIFINGDPAQPTGQSIFESCNQSFLDKEMYSMQLRGLAKNLVM